MASSADHQVLDISEEKGKKEARMDQAEDKMKQWTNEVEGKVKTLDMEEEQKRWKQSSIYRMPSFAIELKKRAFTPQVVSFGPFHHGKGNLCAAEEHKLRALVHFLRRTRRQLGDYKIAMEKDLELLQGCYYRLDDEWKNKDLFTKLMIMDGCFMLEILKFYCRSDGEDLGYAPNDPLFSAHGMRYKLPYIKRDMLMLENQLPLLVLKKLLDPTEKENENRSSEINNMVLKFFGRGEGLETSLGLHVLDVYRKSMLSAGQGDTILRINLSAAGLREAGVNIRKSDTDNIWDVGFTESCVSGTLKLPRITVDDATECTFINLMAFEHLHDGVGSDITSYICFMDELIDSEADVKLLQKKGIIDNALGSDKEAAELFNNLTVEMTVDPSSKFGKTRDSLREYSKKKIHSYRAKLKHTHFRDPWTILALAAGILLLVLASLQTLYSGLSYQLQANPPPPPGPSRPPPTRPGAGLPYRN